MKSLSWVSIKMNDIDKGLRKLKKLMQRENVFKELKARRFYLKPSKQKVVKKAEALRRKRKHHHK